MTAAWQFGRFQRRAMKRMARLIEDSVRHRRVMLDAAGAAILALPVQIAKAYRHGSTGTGPLPARQLALIVCRFWPEAQRRARLRTFGIAAGFGFKHAGLQRSATALLFSHLHLEIADLPVCSLGGTGAGGQSRRDQNSEKSHLPTCK